MKQSHFFACGAVIAAVAVILTLSVPAAGPGPKKAEPSVFTEELTWEEVRDALKAGKTTVLLPTGGVEQNGPYVVTGKHNYFIRATAEAIARKLGNALVAPVVPFVPEGDIDPPSGHMKYPGTISVTEKTYRALLTDICASYRAHAVDPKLIRAEQRKAGGAFKINGVDLHPVEKTAAMGRKIIDWYAETTVKAIEKSLAAKGK